MRSPDALGSATLVTPDVSIMGTACPVEWCRGHADDQIDCGDAAGPFFEGLTHRGRVDKMKRLMRRRARLYRESGLPNPEELMGLGLMLEQAAPRTRSLR